jgi:cytochrome c2
MKNIYIIISLALIVASCGPRSGVSNDTNDPAVCDVKNPSASDSNKILIRTIEQQNGKKLFMSNCRQCHAPVENHICGEGLRGVLDRIPQGKWFNSFVLNSDSLKKENDPYALKIDHDFNQDYEHQFKTVLNSKDIIDIIEYLKIKPTE